MEAKISRTCPGPISSMSKLLWESKQEDEDRLKKISSKIVMLGLGYNYTFFPVKKKKCPCYAVLQHKISNNELWMIGGPLFF